MNLDDGMGAVAGCVRPVVASSSAAGCWRYGTHAASGQCLGDCLPIVHRWWVSFMSRLGPEVNYGTWGGVRSVACGAGCAGCSVM